MPQQAHLACRLLVWGSVTSDVAPTAGKTLGGHWLLLRPERQRPCSVRQGCWGECEVQGSCRRARVHASLAGQAVFPQSELWGGAQTC